MTTNSGEGNATFTMEEVIPKKASGLGILIISIVSMLLFTALFIWGCVMQSVFYIVIGAVVAFIIAPLLLMGLKTLKPNEALVLTLFGKYYGTLRGPGFFFVNPFVSAVNPASTSTTSGRLADSTTVKTGEQNVTITRTSKKISLKSMTLNNDKQKINDQLGNPIIIGIVVIWKVVNTARAVFNVDNYVEYLSIQCDSALRNIVRLYPYDSNGEYSDNEKSLRGSSQEIARRLAEEIQEKVEIAGLEIVEARITQLAYAPEIAAVMLQRQQASAIIDARQMIVDGAVGMVEMALRKLNENDIVHLDEERKAAMVSNLLIVLCGNKDAQPIINSGTLY